MNAKYTAQQIADWFLAKTREREFFTDGDGLSNLKLQKLLYYAQGAYLAKYHKPLFDDPIEAWEYGPAIPKIYDQYKYNYGNPIPFDKTYNFEVIDFDTNELLDLVFDSMGIYSTWYLNNLTQEETPWKTTRRNQEITLDSIKYFFKLNFKEYFLE